jgi:hypothetical protein
LNRLELEKLEKSHQRQKSQIGKAHQKELEFINKNNEQRIYDIEKDQGLKVQNLGDEFNKQKLEKIEEKEKYLTEIDQQMQSQKKALDSQLSTLKDRQQKQREYLDFTQKERLATMQRDHQNRIKNDLEKHNQTLNKLENKTEIEKNGLVRRYDKEINHLDKEKSTDLREKLKKYSTKINKLEKQKSQEISNIQEISEKEKLSTIKQETVNLKHLRTNYIKEKEAQKNLHISTMQDKHIQHEQLASKLIKENQVQAKEIAQRVESLKNKLIEDYSKHQKHFEEIVDDSFYRAQVINPKIKEKEDSFEISLEVPPHEKSGYQVSVAGRKVRITFNRSHNDQFTASDGSDVKSNKAESSVRSLELDAPMDRNKISQVYEDGVLKFSIAKA